jgi:hypothetical protein
VNQQPTNQYEQFLRNEKIKYLLPHISDDMKILDIGGGDGSCWDSVDTRFTVDLLDFNEELSSKSIYYRNIFVSDIKEDNIECRCSKYDVVCLMGILEHVEDPVSLLKAAGKCASVVFITVPNAESFHRYLGVELGIIDDIHQLDSQDIAIGHKRVYDHNMLYEDIIDSKINFAIKDIGTSSFKFAASSSIESNYSYNEIQCINSAGILSKVSGYNRFSGAEIFAVLKRYSDD